MSSPFDGKRDKSHGGPPLGKRGLQEFADRLNDARARSGVKEKYYITILDGLATLADEVQRRR